MMENLSSKGKQYRFNRQEGTTGVTAKSNTTQKVLLQFRCAVCYQSSVIEKCKQHESMSYFTGEWSGGHIKLTGKGL